MKLNLLLNKRTPIIRGFLLLIVLSQCGEASDKNQVLPDPRDAVQAVVKPTMRQFGNDTISELHQYFDSMASAGRFSGIVFTVHGNQRYLEKFGYRHLSQKDSFEFDDQFQLASLSKPITAFGLLKLIDDGRVELDEEVSHYLPEFPFEGVTVRSLLAHTSGIGNYIYVTDSLWNKPDSFMCNNDIFEIIQCKQLPKYYEPLKRFDYCNTNFALIPILAESVTYKPFPEFMRKEVFEPLGMLQTEYLNPKEKPSDQYDVVGHYPSGLPKRPFYLDGVIGDKSLYSNVFDLYKFYLELKSPTLISQETMDEAMSPQAKTSYDRYYGLGWRIAPRSDGDTLVFHNGWWRGFRSYFWMSKQEDKVAIILTNSIRGGYLSQDEIWSKY